MQNEWSRSGQVPGLVRANSFDEAALLACARGELFGGGRAYLPQPPLLLVGRIAEIHEDRGFGGGRLRAELDVAKTSGLFDRHILGDPTVPPGMMLDALWQLLGFYMAWYGGRGFVRPASVAGVRVDGPVQPNVRVIEYGLDVRHVKGKRTPVGVATGWAKADGRPCYSAWGLKVSLA